MSESKVKGTSGIAGLTVLEPLLKIAPNLPTGSCDCILVDCISFPAGSSHQTEFNIERPRRGQVEIVTWHACRRQIGKFKFLPVSRKRKTKGLPIASPHFNVVTVIVIVKRHG